MTDLYLWGKHPAYANGQWIKLERNASPNEIDSRKAQGFELAELELGKHPETFKDEESAVRIYVACLAAYNDGILHGRWIDATQGEEHIRDAIKAMLAKSPIMFAEEWAIHDHEGFEGIGISEYADMASVCAIAAFIDEYGSVAAKLMEHCGDLEDAKETMRDRYAGVYSSVADFAQELTEETTQIPENLQYYIDWESMARDLEINDILALETGFEEVHIFWRH
ncbi:MAG: antirestriction protein ArdA [Alphaproteobacteria bacterium]|jgi:antirestriction protein|nr:antirestriction protein ArdA [Alphaproteobacteria bacterium]QQS56958.1 MAG: antirestriction protein ArdA [Alphaproteobacteria bacterium]